VLNQVLSRIFASYSAEYHQNRRLGLPAFSTPKNVLACGHKLASRFPFPFPSFSSLFYALLCSSTDVVLEPFSPVFARFKQ